MAAFSSAGQVRRRPTPVNASRRRTRSGIGISSEIDIGRSSKPAPNIIPFTPGAGRCSPDDAYDELMTALKIDAGLPPVRLKRRKYMSTALLLIDELGFEPMTRPEASLFFRLVTYRYGRGAILITTNKSVRDWTELLAGDEVLAAAILDRLLHRAHVLNIKGRSYRLRDLEDALKLSHA